MIEKAAKTNTTSAAARGKTARLNLRDIRRSSVFWGILLFRITLDIVYPLMIAKNYWYYGFAYAPDWIRYVLSYFSLLLLTAALLPCISVKRPSSIMLLLLYCLAYVPNMALFSGMSLPYSFFLISNLYWALFLLFFRALCFGRRERSSKLRSIKRNGINEYGIPILVCLVVSVFSIWYNNGIRLTINLRDDYALRLAASQRGLGDIFEKVLPWAANIILPTGLIMSIRDKRWFLSLAFIVGIIFAFSVNGTKTWLFICAISLFMALFVTNDRVIGLLPLALAGLNLLGYALGKAYNWSFINNYIVRRVYFATSMNNFYWLQFFSENPKLYFTNSLLGWLRRFGVQMPYDENVAKIIGRLYYNKETAASSGTIADAYSNFGLFGIALFPLLLVIAFRLMDNICRESRLIYLYPITVSVAVYLLNGGIMTALVTYGYFVGLLLIWVIKRNRDLSL